jgi:predicted nucleic acid-binding protein
VDALLGGEIASCEPVWMEILAGARDERHLSDLRRLLGGATLLASASIDYEEAAALYRICRHKGETPRKLIDCLIAAIAIRADARVLHLDADYEVLSRHTALKLDSGR